jgi:DNA polymerase zeta
LDCKGLEIIRRDQCPLTSRVMADVVSTLFRTRDLSRVKALTVAYFTEILKNPAFENDQAAPRSASSVSTKPSSSSSYSYSSPTARVIALSLSDFIFSKEVKLARYKPGSLPPAAVVSSKMMRLDPRRRPLYNERVQYVVVSAGSNLLRDRVVPPELVASGEMGLLIDGR